MELRALPPVAVVFCFLVAGCGSGNNDSNSNANSTTNSTNENNPTTGGSGEFLKVSGTFRGTPFEIECDLDDDVTSSLTSGGYLGHEQCPVGSNQAQCSHPQQGFAGTAGVLTVSVRSFTEDDAVVVVFDSMDVTGMNGLNESAANLDAMTVDFDSFTAGSAASGSFAATWTDDGSGNAFADVAGTFNWECDG